MKYILLEEAEAEWFTAAFYYEDKRPGLGLQFAGAVHKAIADITYFPLAGSPGEGSTRMRIVAGFPYKIHYLPKNETIFILAIAPHAMRPGYWHSRLTGL